MTTADNYMGLGPEGDIQELPPNSRTYRPANNNDGYMEARTADGTLRRQYRYRKKTDNINYGYAKKALVDRLVYLFESEEPLILRVKINDVMVDKNVWINPIRPERYLVTGEGLFRNVNIELQEI